MFNHAMFNHHPTIALYFHLPDFSGFLIKNNIKQYIIGSYMRDNT